MARTMCDPGLDRLNAALADRYAIDRQLGEGGIVSGAEARADRNAIDRQLGEDGMATVLGPRDS